jgi:hypothetical protein
VGGVGGKCAGFLSLSWNLLGGWGGMALPRNGEGQGVPRNGEGQGDTGGVEEDFSLVLFVLCGCWVCVGRTEGD